MQSGILDFGYLSYTSVNNLRQQNGKRYERNKLRGKAYSLAGAHDK